MPSLVCAEEFAYNEIKQRLLDGRLAPGVRLVHRAFAKELGISPNPVVLALRMLERDGLVANTPGLGASVRWWTRDEIVDLYQVRAFQESLAARLCAERASSTDLEAVVQADEAFQRSTDVEDAEANLQADVAFHHAVVRGAQCPDLERILENLSIMQYSMRVFALSHNIPRFMSPALQHIHEPIVQAVMSRDAEEAERAAREHVEQSLARNLAMIEGVSYVIVNGQAARSRWWAQKSTPAG